MQNISIDELDSVTGATGTVTAGTLPSPHVNGAGGTSGSGCLGGGVLGSLHSISDSIKGLSNNNNNNGLDSNTMLMLGMALAMRNRADSGPVIVNYSGGGGWGGGGWHGGFSWHAHW